jgi:chemotaxis protein MotB
MKELLLDPSPRENAPEWPPLKRPWHKPLGSKNKQNESEKGYDLWLLTLSDLLLLLMIFFVLLFGMTLQQQGEAHSSPQAAAVPIKPEEAPVEMQLPSAPESASKGILASFETDLRAILGDNENKEEVSLTRQADHLILTFPERIVFDPGRAEVKPSLQPILDKVGSLAVAHPDLLVEVQGHTDDRPINTKRYPSNWELSVDRATQVVKTLIALGLDPAQISVKGFGEYRNLYPNDSESNRGKNRRVEIQFSLPPQS